PCQMQHVLRGCTQGGGHVAHSTANTMSATVTTTTITYGHLSTCGTLPSRAGGWRRGRWAGRRTALPVLRERIMTRPLACGRRCPPRSGGDGLGAALLCAGSILCQCRHLACCRPVVLQSSQR